jgi:4-amino-4-deoxy-L-arabinose transferase-like glycosyltransferase
VTKILSVKVFPIVCVLLYFILGILFAVRTPAWQAPDEPAHYHYIAQVARKGCCPLIEMGDWDSSYLNQLTSNRFAPALLTTDFDRIQYEDHQPPLYYLLLSPVYQITDGSLIALRITSALIGAIIVLCAYGVGAVMFPARPEIGLGAAAFVAFHPQQLAILASVNNDALGWALVGMTLLVTVIYLKPEYVSVRVQPWQLGVLVGLIFVSKSTAYLMAGVVGLALVLRWLTDPARDWRILARRLALFLLPALLIGLLWWGRNIALYGFPDFLGLRAHDAVVVGQLRTDDYLAQLGTSGYFSEALRTTFYSFWGMFGWMALPMPAWAYAAIGALLGVGLSGLLLRVTLLRGKDPSDTPPWTVWAVLITVTLLSVLQFLYYNTEFVQFQGRYMFPLLIPLGIWLALGIDAWRRILVGQFAWTRWLVALIFLGFAILDVWLIWRLIPPNLL